MSGKTSFDTILPFRPVLTMESLEHLEKIFIAISTAIVFYLFTLCFYRIFLHPLSKYPGPLLAKVTDWYSVYHAYTGDRHVDFYRLHNKYGKFVRFGPNSVSVNSATALKDIYGHGKNFRKADFYKAFPAVPGVHNTHNAIKKEEHGRKRRVLSQAFSENALKNMEYLVLDNIRLFCDQMENLPGAKNMASWFNYLTFDVMGELCFGKAFGMLKDESTRFVTRLIDKAAHRHYICGNYPLIDALHIDKILFPTISRDRWKFILHSRAQANERTKQGPGFKKDFFHYLLNAKDPETGEGFATVELWGEANVLMIAGSDTTSTALAATMYYMLKNPDTLERATKEVRDSFNDVEEIVSGKELTDCGYLRACIDEALRMAPPVPGALPRAAMRGGANVDGEHFPEGTVMGTPCYAIHHNEKYYPDPFQFNPERWISDSNEQMELARAAYNPFSIGPRGCIGKGVALMELRLTLARVLWLFDVKAEGKLTEHYEITDHFTSQKDGPMVSFTKRVVA